MALQDEMIIEQIQIGPMQNFAYIIGCKSTREVAVIDPAWDIEALLNLMAERDYKLTAALVTHYHPDHCGGSFGQNKVAGVAELLALNPVKIYTHKLEADGLKKVTGISDNDMTKVDSGDKLKVGDVEVEFLHTPGHTPGSQCFLVEETGGQDRLVSGDTLFLGSCGRVDLPGSDPEAMYESLTGTLGRLPDSTLLYPGHLYSPEPSSTMEEQKRTNPFLRVASLEQFLMFIGA